MKNKIDYICEKCCSNSVLIKTEAVFDRKTQQFDVVETELENTGYCYNCNDIAWIKETRLLNNLIQELDISIACLLDTVIDGENLGDLEHIQDCFTRLSNMIVSGEANIYE
jgi:hypothetical protein